MAEEPQPGRAPCTSSLRGAGYPVGSRRSGWTRHRAVIVRDTATKDPPRLTHTIRLRHPKTRQNSKNPREKQNGESKSERSSMTAERDKFTAIGLRIPINTPYVNFGLLQKHVVRYVEGAYLQRPRAALAKRVFGTVTTARISWIAVASTVGGR